MSAGTPQAVPGGAADRARDLFREAGASARSPLQVAMAERYLVLRAIGLGRPEAGLVAWRLLTRSRTDPVRAAVGVLERRARARPPADHRPA